MRQYIVVDDDNTSNLICQFVIKGFDREACVKTYNHPEKAIACIKGKDDRLDLNLETILFLDLNMPAMSGWEFLEALEKTDRDLIEKMSIFILSSSIEDFSEEKKRYPYVAGFLSKPLTKEHLQGINQELKRI